MGIGSTIGGIAGGYFGGSGGAAIGSSIGGLFDSNSANSKAKRAEERNYAFQKEMQQNQLNWEKEKFETSYQTAVKDLQKAGLNPVLAAMNGGNTSGSISGGSGTDVTGNAATQNFKTGTDAINNALDRMENARVNNSVINSNNSSAGLNNAQTGLTKKEAKWYDRRQAKELSKLDFESAKTQKETELLELQRFKSTQTMNADIQKAFGDAADAVARGYLGGKEMEALQTLGFSRKELLQLGEWGIRMIGNLFNLRVGMSTIREIAGGIIKNNKNRNQTPMRRNRGSWEGYTPSPYDRFAADNNTYNNWYNYY